MECATLTTLANEEWRAIKGYEGLYEVSNLGRVRSLDRMYYKHYKDGRVIRTKLRGRILKPTINNNGAGYYMVSLVYKNVYVTRTVHRLVAIAFIPNPDNLPEVNHKDENTRNNCVDNLEWCTRLYNARYGTGIERNLLPRRRKIEQLTKDGKHIAYHLGVRELCRVTGMHKRSIQNCLNKKPKFKTAYGYIWRYVNVGDDVEFDLLHSSVQYTKKDRTVEQLTKDGKHIAYYKNPSQAAMVMSCTLQNILRAINAPHQTANGYKWKYVN